MSKASRDKGLLGEREVKHAFHTAGIPAKGLEGQGDHLVVCTDWLTLHVEVKRAEALRMSDWSRQAESEAAQGTVPTVVYRRSREPWRASLRLDDLIALLTEVQEVRARLDEHHSVGVMDGRLIGDTCPICAPSLLR